MKLNVLVTLADAYLMLDENESLQSSITPKNTWVQGQQLYYYVHCCLQIAIQTWLAELTVVTKHRVSLLAMQSSRC